MKRGLKTVSAVILLCWGVSPAGIAQEESEKPAEATEAAEAAEAIATGNVIFIHPDGSGVQHWAACRMLNAGPDGEINWDKLPEMGVYRGHMKDGLTSTSHGGATTHAYGVKVLADSYGMDGTEELTSLSGFQGSIMAEAIEKGKPVGIVNSGHIGEPGTGAFLASVPQRGMKREIAQQVMESGAEVIMCGGEELLLPTGVKGFHGAEGKREDERNLIEEAKEHGYTVVYTREQLKEVDPTQVERILGVFAAGDTYNDYTDAELGVLGLPHYNPEAPTVGEMLEVALQILSRQDENFLLVLEEEGSDNFSNYNNATGALEAMTRADAAVGVALDFVKENPDTMIITAADSDAGGLQLHCPPPSYRQPGDFEPDRSLDYWMRNGAPLDGQTGQGGVPFLAAPDANGARHVFGIAYAGYSDFAGGILSKAAGLNAEKLGNNVDNTDVYRMMYLTLFGEELPSPIGAE